MSLRINNLIGFGGGPKTRTIILAVSSSENDYVLYDKLSAAGHNPGSATQGGGKTVIKSVCSNSIFLGSTDTGHAAVRTHDGDTYGAGWAEADWQIITEGTDTATIEGKGGAGGTGSDFTTGSGEEFGGGGGGGAGTQVGAAGLKGGVGANDGNPGTASAGGTGGTKGGPSAGVDGGSAGGAGGVALEASSGGPNITLRPASGATLRIWGGGGGGGGGNAGVVGGTGGGPGLDGGAGSAGGGANGLAYSTPGAATITETGPGTIDKRGT